ncbi:nucleolar complex protein 3 homolog isoform X1 [Lagenorhynchus albirostris]|uniref:nucleolar complex protein 3 homolog isoform X1 n=1 Tax=Lagenorhynchus albirostris TaxID=27610 RepID=UPI0028ED9C30|nr:nucleolar complex protein 3 homolog isoform X1 [Lagenorhynchus albirostris]
MKARRNKKQVPSFRKLLKTSKVKLENKLKNKQFKQQSTLKKYRKEQRKLRQAVKDAVSKKPIPLEDPKEKRPGKRIEREEEEEEEALPLDMMDEDDLQLMKDLGQRASFLTRDLSSSEPVHARKRKHEHVIDKYEKIPRTLQTAPEKELIHLLPIKDKSGIIPQTREKPVIDSNQDEEDQEEMEPEEEIIEEPIKELTLEEHLIERKKKLQEKKMRIAALASAILSDPESNIKKLKELRSMLMEQDPDVAVTVRKLVIVSLMELFKDITPSYKIRPLTEAEKSTKIRKETQKLREFEEGLVSQYKFYLENLEQIVKDWKQRKLKKSNVVSLKAYKGLAEVAVKSLCELLVALPHFNFHNNIIVLIVPLMNDMSKLVSEMCCEAVKKLFKQDKLGQASLGVIKVISGFVKGRNYEVRPEMLKTFLCLRIKEVEVKKDTEDINKQKKFMTFKEKRKTLSRMQRKWKKAEEKLERELREAEASESTEKKLKLHTETLNIVFVTYFRILKKAQRSPLLPAVLEGLAKFAHLINVEFFDDLLVVLHSLIESGDLSYQESLHCVQTAFHVLSGQGDVLNIDPMKFYTHLYKTLFKLHAGATNEGVEIVLQCLDVMLTKRRKQVSQQRALAFIKRLCTLALHVLPNSSIGILATNRILMHTFPKTDLLLDNESQGSGVFLPELDEPEYCNAQNTALWELHALRRHYHPIVQRFAAHLIAGAPSEGSEALKPELSRRSPAELFEAYSMAAMTFNPPVESSNSKRKDKVLQGDSFLSEEISQLIKRHCSEVATQSPLDFTKYLETSVRFCVKKEEKSEWMTVRASLVPQWLRICLPMQETRV